MNIRLTVVAVALAFGIWEAVDTADTGAPAAVFSILFLLSALWLYRRSSRLAALLVLLLCTVEASQAHTWKDAGPVAKDAAMALGSVGILAALAFLARAVSRPSRTGRSAARST